MAIWRFVDFWETLLADCRFSPNKARLEFRLDVMNLVLEKDQLRSDCGSL